MKSTQTAPWILTLGLLLAAPALPAEESRQELLEMKNTVMNLVDALVEQGILDASQAEALKDKARAQAAKDARQEMLADQETGKKVVRVPYVPEFVREEIKEEVRAEVRADVLADVDEKAKEEEWGTPGALPDWVNRFDWFGDFRVRYAQAWAAKKNLDPSLCAYLNATSINAAGSFTGAEQPCYNFAEGDRRMRIRFRLGFEAGITDEFTVGARMATSSSPVSRNVDMGNSLDNYGFTLERAYMRYEFGEERWGDLFGGLTLWGGKFQVPYITTEMVWDNDINLTGLSAVYERNFDFARGDEGGPYTFFMATGIHPIELQESAIADGIFNDKYVSAFQIALARQFAEDSSARVSTAIYDYSNIQGQTSPAGSSINYWTAPSWLQKGNSLFDITGEPFPNDPTYLGLVTDYTMLNVIGEAQFGHFAPYMVDVTAAYVKNIGYSKSDFRALESLGFVGFPDLDSRDTGYEVSVYAGYPEIHSFGQWRAGARYVYLESDAVLDAYTNSNFQAGGTNYKGWQADISFGVTENSFARLRYFSTNEITDAPLGLDILLLDYQANF